MTDEHSVALLKHYVFLFEASNHSVCSDIVNDKIKPLLSAQSFNWQSA